MLPVGGSSQRFRDGCARWDDPHPGGNRRPPGRSRHICGTDIVTWARSTLDAGRGQGDLLQDFEKNVLARIEEARRVIAGAREVTAAGACGAAKKLDADVQALVDKVTMPFRVRTQMARCSASELERERCGEHLQSGDRWETMKGNRRSKLRTDCSAA